MNVLEWAVSSVLGSPNSQAGAIDVIAVRKSDGTLSCSPFHVKLGKSSKKGERRVVKLKVNGRDVDLSMKLGPAGEAFFVERSRDFGRRDSATPYPGSPFHLGNSSYEELISPREEPDVPSPLPEVVSSAVAPVKSRENLPSLVTAGSPGIPLKALKQPTPPQRRSRPRSLSESEVIAKSTSLEAFLSKPTKLTCVTEFSAEAPTPSAYTEDVLGEAVEVFEEAAPRGRRVRAASDMSELVGASQRAARTVDMLGTITAHSSTTTLDADGEAAGEQVQSAEVDVSSIAEVQQEPAVDVAPKDDSAVSWIWRWGYLPVKTKPKSSTDLEGLSHKPAAVTASSDSAAAAIVSELVDSVSSAAAETTGTEGAQASQEVSGLRDVRGRAVSLPMMFPAMSDDGSGTRAARRLSSQPGRTGLEPHSKRAQHLLHPRHSRGDGFTLRVTAVEGGLTDLGADDLNANNPEEETTITADFASMLSAAVEDTSRFRALSLCGHVLSSAGTSDALPGKQQDADAAEEYPATREALMKVLDAHRITPRDIATSPSNAKKNALTLTDATDPAGSTDSSILTSPHLVVILDDFLLPLAAAEKWLAKACKTGSGDSADAHLSDSDVATVLAELSAELHAAGTSLPVWAGRRISLWGNTYNDQNNELTINPEQTSPSKVEEQVSADCPSSADKSDRDDGATPLGNLSWKESFSDLVQAYRVRNIQSIHSLHVSGAGSGRDSYVTSPFLQEFINPVGKHPLSYRELWRRQQHMGKSGSFTALLTLDAGGSNSIYGTEDQEKWASSDDAQDGYGVGYSLHPERLSDASSHSLTALASIEEAHERAEAESAEASVKSATEITTAAPLSPAANVELPYATAATVSTTGPGPSSASYMRDAPVRSLHSLDNPIEGGSSQPSVVDEGDTDNDNLSIQDIDLEDISPEPAGGDFYDSDTDSYLSLSLEDGEAGSVGSGKAGFSINTPGTGAGAAEGGLAKRRFKKYRYRKVLVPSQEQLDLLDLKDGPNEIVFELPGCVPLKSCLFVWPADAKVVVTDLEGVFSKKHNPRGSGVWINFLGGGSYYSAAASKTEFDSCIRLFRGLAAQGYRIIYLAQGSMTSPTASSLLSSQDYLSSIKTSTGECLPSGPIFKSPDSLVRAFGAGRTEVFKASALRGVKSLFPSTHNPYHACFCTREGDAIPFARFGFPEGRIFLVSEKGDIKSANRTCILSFPRLNELLHQIFPMVIDSQSLDLIIGGSAEGKANRAASVRIKSETSTASSTNAATEAAATAATAATAASIASPTAAGSGGVGGADGGAGGSNKSTGSTGGGNAAATTAEAAAAAASKAKGVSFSQLRASTEDTYNDFNYWKIPPAIIDDDFY